MLLHLGSLPATQRAVNLIAKSGFACKGVRVLYQQLVYLLHLFSLSAESGQGHSWDSLSQHQVHGNCSAGESQQRCEQLEWACLQWCSKHVMLRLSTKVWWPPSPSRRLQMLSCLQNWDEGIDISGNMAHSYSITASSSIIISFCSTFLTW